MKSTITFLMGLALFSLTGCGDGGPSLVKVTGTITLDGKPWEGALVEYMPDQSTKEGTIGADTTGASGNYMIRSTAGRTGVAPGKYKVRVAKAPETSTSSAGDDSPTPKNDPGQMLAESAAAGAAKKKADDAKSVVGNFTADVTSAGGVFDFDVKSPGK